MVDKVGIYTHTPKTVIKLLMFLISGFSDCRESRIWRWGVTSHRSAPQHLSLEPKFFRTPLGHSQSLLYQPLGTGRILQVPAKYQKILFEKEMMFSIFEALKLSWGNPDCNRRPYFSFYQYITFSYKGDWTPHNRKQLSDVLKQVGFILENYCIKWQ